MLAVIGALVANRLITILKFIAAVFTGSLTQKNVQAIRLAIKAHPSVVEVVELLTMHLAPKQIPVNAHINLRNELTNEEIVKGINEIENNINKAAPKVDMIFLEASSLKDTTIKEIIPQHIG